MRTRQSDLGHPNDDERVGNVQLVKFEEEDKKPILLSSCGVSRRDMLSVLPSEILALVFEQVRFLNEEDGYPQMLGVVSKSLIPHCRRNIFHSVDVSTPRALDRFWNIIKKSRRDNEKGHDLAILVESFSVYSYTFGGTNWTTTKAASLLLYLHRLKKLVVKNVNVFSEAALSWEVTEKGLKRLEELTIYDPHHCLIYLTECCDGPPLSVPCYAALQEYKKLTKLSVSVKHLSTVPSKKSAVPKQVRAIEDLQDNETVKELCIDGFLDDIKSNLTDFIGVFTNLEKLHLINTNAVCTVPSCFDKVASTLQHLTVESVDAPYNPARDHLDSAIYFLPNLTTLTINLACFSTSFFSLLAICCHLERLHLKDDTRSLHFAELLPLVGSGRPSSLQTITMDNFRSVHGGDMTRIEKVDFTCHESYMKVLPEWHRHFSFAQAVEFVKRAKRAGIVVSGCVLDAIRVQTAFEKAQRAQS